MNPGRDPALFQKALSDLADSMEALGIGWQTMLRNAFQIPFHSLSIFPTEETADPRSER